MMNYSKRSLDSLGAFLTGKPKNCEILNPVKTEALLDF